MKTRHKQNFLAVVLSCGLMEVLVACSSTPTPPTQAPVQTQQVPIPTTAAEVPGPVAGTAMTKEYVQMVGRMAYLWGWPLVNSHNRRFEFGKAPSLDWWAASCPLPPLVKSPC